MYISLHCKCLNMAFVLFKLYIVILAQTAVHFLRSCMIMLDFLRYVIELFLFVNSVVATLYLHVCLWRIAHVSSVSCRHMRLFMHLLSPFILVNGRHIEYLVYYPIYFYLTTYI